MRQDGPTIGVRVGMPKSDGFRTWSEDDIAAFEAIYPVGSKAQFALALLLNPALRCSLTWSAWAGAMSAANRAGRGASGSGAKCTGAWSAIVLKIPLVAEFPMDKSIATGL